MATKSDKELIKQFLAGDQNAFELFVKRHQDRVYRLACARLYAQDDAVDVAQEVFLRAYKGFSRFYFNAEPFTWIYKTLENVCSEFNRKTKRDRLYHQPLDDAIDVKTDDYDGAEHLHMRQVRNVIHKLPKRQQDVVLLRIFEGMSVEETALILNCRQGTIKAHLHKAMENLRKHFNNAKAIENE